MFNLGRKRNIVVMDGTDKGKLNAIVSIVRMMAGENSVKDLHRLDDNHQSMMVMKVKTTKSRFEDIEDVISNTLPGLCNFNVPL